MTSITTRLDDGGGGAMLALAAMAIRGFSFAIFMGVLRDLFVGLCCRGIVLMIGAGPGRKPKTETPTIGCNIDA
jgi:hypothetical protein